MTVAPYINEVSPMSESAPLSLPAFRGVIGKSCAVCAAGFDWWKHGILHEASEAGLRVSWCTNDKGPLIGWQHIHSVSVDGVDYPSPYLGCYQSPAGVHHPPHMAQSH